MNFEGTTKVGDLKIIIGIRAKNNVIIVFIEQSKRMNNLTQYIYYLSYVFGPFWNSLTTHPFLIDEVTVSFVSWRIVVPSVDVRMSRTTEILLNAYTRVNNPTAFGLLTYLPSKTGAYYFLGKLFSKTVAMDVQVRNIDFIAYSWRIVRNSL